MVLHYVSVCLLLKPHAGAHRSATTTWVATAVLKRRRVVNEYVAPRHIFTSSQPFRQLDDCRGEHDLLWRIVGTPRPTNSCRFAGRSELLFKVARDPMITAVEFRVIDLINCVRVL